VIPALLLLAAPPADPADVHDVLLEVGDRPPLRLRLRVEYDGRPLARLDAAAKRDRDAIRGKPGIAALDRLTPDGSLLRAEALPAPIPHQAALTRALAAHFDKHGFDTDKVLRAFDLDEDECVTPLELVPDLQTAVPADVPSPDRVRVSVVPVAGKADVEQAVKVGRAGSYWRGKVGGVWVELHGRPGLPAERPATPKALLAADRAGAKAAFEKAAAGVVTLTAVPGPAGWFDRLDADRDGQLSVAELRRARDVLAGADAGDTGVSLVFVPGAARPPAVPLVRTFARTAGPAWFRGMDRNADGYVSPREFLGTPEQFKTLDRDGDGLISPAEAAAAKEAP
jgi:hypothetical protein